MLLGAAVNFAWQYMIAIEELRAQTAKAIKEKDEAENKQISKNKRQACRRNSLSAVRPVVLCTLKLGSDTAYVDS